MNAEKKFSVKAVVIGWLVAVVGSAIIGGIIAAIFAFTLVGPDMDPVQIQEQLADSIGLQSAGLIVGLIFSILGGYLAALIAKFAELKHALWVGILSVLIGLLGFLMPQQAGLLLLLAGIILTIPAALLGGYLRAVTRKDQAEQPAA